MTDKTTLCEITDAVADCERIARWRNENARWFPKQAPWTAYTQEQWYYDTYLSDPSQNIYFVAVNDIPIGLVGMTIRRGSGELERMILGDKTYARGGYMRQGMRQLMDAYGLAHYWLKVMPDNLVTINFHKRNGFSIFSYEGGEYENIHGEHGKYVLMARSYDGYWPEVPVK